MEARVDRPVPSGISVAGQGILRLGLGLVEDAKVGPGRPVLLVELDCADVGLQGVHGLVLLLVKNSYGAPGVSVRLGLVHRVPVGNEGVVDLSNAGVTPAKEVERLAGLGFALN